MDKTKKYTYLVPGLERYRLETKKDVKAKIEELALLNREFINEDTIKKLYSDHRRGAENDLHFIDLHERLKSHHSMKSEMGRYKIIRQTFLNYSIIHRYYAYVYIDFPEYFLSIDYVIDTLAIQHEYVSICSNIMALYDSADFSHIVMPQIQSDIDYCDKRDALLKKSSGIGGLSIRMQYNIGVKIDAQYRKEIKYPKFKPEHYMNMILLGNSFLGSISISALKGIVEYHLQTQDEAKKLHNASYIELGKKKARKKSNSDRISEWIKVHPGNNSKDECSKDLGIHRSTVYRNWGELKK